MTDRPDTTMEPGRALTSGPRSVSRATAHGDAVDQRIRVAAVRLFSEKGAAAVGIRELAREAGLTSATLYHYVGSKEQLLVELMRDGLSELLDLDRRATATHVKPPARLVSLMHTHVMSHAMAPEICGVIDNEMRALSPAARTEVVALRDTIEQLWRGVVDDGRRDGWFRATTSLDVTVRAMLDMSTGVASWFRPDGPRTAEQVALDLCDIALSGLDARVGTGPRARACTVGDLPISVRQVWDLGALQLAVPGDDDTAEERQR